jgi:hypothetical protein
MYIHMIVRNCKKWIIARETLYRTNVLQSIVSNCVDLTHHFILKYTAYYYYFEMYLIYSGLNWFGLDMFGCVWIGLVVFGLVWLCTDRFGNIWIGFGWFEFVWVGFISVWVGLERCGCSFDTFE